MSSPVKNKQRRKKIMLALALAAMALVVLVFGTGKFGWINMLRLHRRQIILQKKILVNLAHNEILKRELGLLRENRLFIEARIREDLGMVRPGEVSYRFYPADSLRRTR
jgi:cell division protein FtsB